MRRARCARRTRAGTVTLAGWVARRRDHGGVVFIDLRDASGVVQVVFRAGGRARTTCGPSSACWSPATVRRRPAGNENPELATGEIEVAVDRASRCWPSPTRCRSRSTGAAELNEEVRLRYRYLDIRRPEMAAALRARSAGGLPGRRRDAGPRVRQRGDAVPDQVHPGGRARLPGAGPAAPRQLVRAAAVPAAVQAAADGRRPGALLPAGPLLPRRGLPRRPAARVHPDRHRDVASSPARTSSRSPRTWCSGCGRRSPGTRCRGRSRG